MAEIPLYCLCGQPYDSTRFMIQCDFCKDWFHGGCVGVKEYQSIDIDKYFCMCCEPRCGPTVYKPRLNWHRHDQSDPDAFHKPTQSGTPAFIKELKSRQFANGEEIIMRLRGQQLTLPYLHSNGFTQPILIEGKDGLGLHVPQDSFTVQDVENYVGSERIIDVIDVTRQADIRMTLHDFVDYYSNPLRPKVFNVISLEFSDTHLSALVDAPYIARKLCWVNNLWPRDCALQRPEVQKYCLMGVQDSYTDFHIDFGGSSVWYHVLKGEKVFYFVPPTSNNLSLYQRWMCSPNQYETFFGDMVETCYKFTITQGQTMLIPTGWIHAVWTVKDSLVFGGNFLHSLNISLQLRVYEIEKATKAPERFRFPLFETLHWFAAERLVEDLKDMNSKGTRCPEHIIQGVRSLLTTLKIWGQEKENGKGRREPIPERIVASKLLKDLSRELRHAERNCNMSGINAVVSNPLPVKIERESSKRVRRKPQTRADFVDINEALSNFAAEEERLAMKASKNTTVSEMVDHLPTSQVGTTPLRFTLPNPRVKTESIRGIKSQTVPLKLLLPKQVNSTIGEPTTEDAEDDDREGSLMIDEKKVPKRDKPKPIKVGQLTERGPLKLRLSVGARSELQFAETTEVAAHMDVETGSTDDSSPSKNGIEELLRASSLASTEALDDLENSGRTSPSTREAIVGMLTMSRGFDSQNPLEQGSSVILNSGKDSAPPLLPAIAQRQRKGRRRLNTSLTDEFGEVVSKVHQDDEYIYPSLDASDDEIKEKDVGRKKSGKTGRARRNGDDDSGDESWNPRARVGPVMPKTDRPVREGVKRPAVERVLEAAAQKRAFEPPPKRPYHRRKKLKPVVAEGQQQQQSLDQQRQQPIPGPSSVVEVPAPVIKVENKGPLIKKPKKGMATAKQRLGKILKIHKMVY